MGPESFRIGRTLGRGAYAHVVHAELRATGELVALKIVEKAHVKKHGKVAAIMRERKAMGMLNHPLVVKLLFSFQNKSCLYFALELCVCDLSHVISAAKKRREAGEGDGEGGALDEKTAQLVSAQLVLALRYVHSVGIVHRDIKVRQHTSAVSSHLIHSSHSQGTCS